MSLAYTNNLAARTLWDSQKHQAIFSGVLEMKLSFYPIHSRGIYLTVTTVAALVLSYPLKAIAKISQASVQISVLCSVQIDSPFSIALEASDSDSPKVPVPEVPGGKR
ncbi:MAG: hypothetical protein LDL41_26340 [Coleofasciculus sp. S288]|nr:hypothetical protein [Coleofasciculus sp. S288]